MLAYAPVIRETREFVDNETVRRIMRIVSAPPHPLPLPLKLSEFSELVRSSTMRKSYQLPSTENRVTGSARPSSRYDEDQELH